MECGSAGAVFRSGHCRFPCVALRLSAGFGARIVVPSDSNGSASLARAHGYDLNDPSFAARVIAFRKESDLVYIQRTVSTGHRKQFLAPRGLRGSAAAEYSGERC
jgi:hypothetical protein